MKTSSKFKRFALARFEALDIEGIDKANAKKLRIALEREILSRTATASDQTEALNGLVAELNALGHRLVPVKSDPGWTSYHQHTNNGERTLHIHAQFDPVGTSVMVLYSETLERTVAIRRAGMTQAERKRADMESEYLERGMALNTSGQSYSSLGPTDRLIACLHELEGSVIKALKSRTPYHLNISHGSVFLDHGFDDDLSLSPVPPRFHRIAFQFLHALQDRIGQPAVIYTGRRRRPRRRNRGDLRVGDHRGGRNG